MLKALLALAISAFAGAAFGQTPQAGLVGAGFRDFSGGYVDAVEPSNLKQSESPNAQDVVIDDPVGSLKPRNGFVRCGNTPSGNAPTNLFQFAKSDGSKNLIVTDNASVWTTRDCVNFTTIKNSGLSASQQVYFTVARDKVWMVNGTTNPWTWDGSTMTILAGQNNSPNPTVPKCAYVEFWHERVWCANTSGNPSAVYFSALTDSSGGDIDPSTGTAAWPASNFFQINQNGGSPIYGIKAYRDRLYVFKDNGIWEIQFNNEFDNAVRKTFSSVGSRFHSSITEIDGLLYFVGKDGIYAFDGDQSVRLSGPIENKFLALNQPQISSQFKTWTTQSDFQGGTLSSTTATDYAGSVVISSQPTVITNGDFELGMAGWTAVKSSLTDGNTVASTVTAGAIYGTYSAQITANAKAGCPNATARVYLFDTGGSTLTYADVNQSALSTTVSTFSINAYNGQIARVKFEADDSADSGGTLAAMWSTTFTVNGDLQYAYQFFNNNGCAGGTNLFGFTYLDRVNNYQYYSSGTWTSDIYNTVAVSTWSTFNANSATNGGTISYEIRFGTDTGATQAASYAAITPGSVIGGTTYQIYVQVRATLNATTDKTSSPRLDDIQLSWTQGGTAANKLFAAGWKNRLWITASSGTSTTNNLALVKSRLPLNSWMLYGVQLGAMTVFNDAFYVGASTHSAIYRMDYGTNDDGAAINWFWETREEMWELPFKRKRLLELSLDFKKGTANNVLVGYSNDYGASFTNSTVSMYGSGRGTQRLFLNGGYSHSFRFRVGSNTIDESATITGITPWAIPLTLRE